MSISHDELSPEEADRRRDEALKRALATPHKPHEKQKKGNDRQKR